MRTITAQAALGLINRFLFGIMAIVSAYGTLLRRYTISKNMEAGRPAAFWSKSHCPSHKVFLNIDRSLCPLSNSPGSVSAQHPSANKHPFRSIERIAILICGKAKIIAAFTCCDIDSIKILQFIQ